MIPDPLHVPHHPIGHRPSAAPARPVEVAAARTRLAAGYYEREEPLDIAVGRLAVELAAHVRPARSWHPGDDAELHAPSGVYAVRVIDRLPDVSFDCPAVLVRVEHALGEPDPVTALAPGSVGTWPASMLTPPPEVRAPGSDAP